MSGGNTRDTAPGGNTRDTAPDGIILLDKPPGMTSFQALIEIKDRLGTRRVGHAGTLDRFAEGLLIVLAGRMARLAAFASLFDKEYVARMTFGRATDTLDPEGRLVAEGNVPAREELETVLPEFLGEISQVPPAYSAVHAGGERAYKAARRGEEVRLEPRRVTIRAMNILDFSPPEAVLRIACSKGTYIRSLARDIAARLGTCAFVSWLRRIRIGTFMVEEARAPGDFDPKTDLLQPIRFFETGTGLARVTLRDSWVAKAFTGTPLTEAFFEQPPENDGIYGAFSRDGRLVAILEKMDRAYRYAAVFSGGQEG